MKWIYSLIIIMLLAGFNYGSDFKIVTLNKTGGAFDIMCDQNNILHFVWEKVDGLHYGQIVKNKVIMDELIPGTFRIQSKFQRPRMGVKPDGSTIHIVYMTSAPSDTLLHAWRDGKGWHKETVWKKSGRYYISHPNIVCDSTGKLHVIASKWAGSGSAWTKIVYLYKNVGKRWNTNEIVLMEGARKWRDTSMAVGPDGSVWGSFKTGSGPGYLVTCKSGGNLSKDNAPVLIAAPEGMDAVSFGDIYVDRSLTVYHGYRSIRQKEAGPVFFAYKSAKNKKFGASIRADSGDKVRICHDFDSWPAIGADEKGTVYVSWAEMPCPNDDANVVRLATYEKGKWKRENLATDAHLSEWKKPAIAVSEYDVYVMWRRNNKEIVLATKKYGSRGIAITTPLGGARVCGSTKIEVSIEDVNAKDAITGMELFIDGTSVSTVSDASKLTYTWSTSEIAPGKHVIKAIGTRASSEKVEYEITVDKDCPPTVHIVKPINGSTVYDVETLEVNVSDEKGIKNVKFYIDGKKKRELTKGPYTYSWNTNNYSEGSHRVKVTALDTSAQLTREEIEVNVFRLYPPSNLSGKRQMNRSLFYVQYTDILKWEKNPANNQRNVVKYKVYLVDGDNKTLLKEIGANETLEYVHRDVSKDTPNTYEVYAVSSQNGKALEGKPSVIKLSEVVE